MKFYGIRILSILFGVSGSTGFAPLHMKQLRVQVVATNPHAVATSRVFFQDPKDELTSLEDINNPLHASKVEESDTRRSADTNLKLNMKEMEEETNKSDDPFSFLSQIMKTQREKLGGVPPMQIEDTPLLFYDIFLILNLSVSISFWVVHRMSFFDITPAFSEGSLLSILWIVAGLLNGSFLYSAVDGHYDVSKEEYADKGGPRYAALLGLSTMVTTANLRILVALLTAFVEHRHVGYHGEELIPLEIAFGLILMPFWRMLHSNYAVR